MREDFSGARDDGHLVELWLTGRPPGTAAGYKTVVAKWLPQVGTIRELTAAALLEWSQTIEGAPGTKVRIIATVKSLLSFAWRTGYTGVNVGRLLRCQRVPDDLHERIPDQSAVPAMMAVAKTDRDKLLVRLLYISGIRLSEAIGLRRIDVGPGRITVVGKGRRTRTLVVPPGLSTDLLALRDGEPGTRIFWGRQGPLKVRAARDVIYRLARGAGIQIMPHALRHLHSTTSLESGAPIHVVQKSLGHRNISTTSRYLHVRPGVGSSQWLTDPG